MRILEAKHSGFCPGVKRAVDTAQRLTNEHPDAVIATLGELIHNPTVIGALAQRGVTAVAEDGIPALLERADGKPCILIIRAHGTTLSMEQTLEALCRSHPNLRVVDCTCPFVKNIHRIAAEESAPYADAPGEALGIIFGDPNHPEVRGINSRFSCETRIFPDSAAVEAWCATEDARKFSQKRVIYVSQTTQKLSECKISQKFIGKLYTNAKIFDTICNVTENRQTETEQIAEQADLMLVIGGKGSSNTQKLYDICRARCELTYFIEGPDDVPRHLFRPHMCAGITAGASTPDSIIQEVKKTMSEIEIMEENFAQMLDESFKTLNTGDVVKGIVTSISANEIHVDIGSKVTGILSFNDVTDDPTADIANMFQVGDEVEAIAVRVSDIDGVATLSKKKVDNANSWNDVVAAYNNCDILTGKIVDCMEKGVIILIKGLRVFIPASHTGLPREADLKELQGTTQNVKIIDINEQRRRAVASIREVLRAERKEKEAAFWAEMEVGKEFDGVVKSFMPYGAFVDLGGVDGMVHTSELAWGRVRHPSEVVSIGDSIHVYVKDFDADAKRISLGYKTDATNPWKIFTDKYQVEDVATVKIVNMLPFGAFAEIIPGVDGLIHISQIANKRINNPAEVLEKGQEVEVKIVGIDDENQKVSLSIRALLSDAAAAEEAEIVEEAGIDAE
ncbi:MAG: bifunctional 4-hydroxy-3-methylbut-2-enyl diphosphate reductase/30S ribosomal protein S1 [Clostridia bacterium]|nr:bifunctional 4-hydroxy-3-methylbut-2-enyl diphosphate reductase/30S ribosomal protein S1 [Clostridia bacterium]